MLLANLQEIRGGNQKVRLNSIEPHGEYSRVIVFTRGGIVIGEHRVTLEKTTEESRVIRVGENTQVFGMREEINLEEIDLLHQIPNQK
jgi:hypothetical protein